LQEDHMMKHLDIPSRQMADYRSARNLAMALAQQQPDLESPELIAWHDAEHLRMSPAIEGANIDTRWRDYGASHCGCLEISVGNYDFIFADGAPYETYGPSPYVNLHDASGREYLCLRARLHDAHMPESSACYPLDDYTSKMT
jgi:hypothetical protein